MTYHTDAVYEGGVLRPLVPLDLDEHAVVSISIFTSEKPEVAEDVVAHQRRALLAYVAKVESQPDDTRKDGLSNRDHDRLIYGN